MHVAPTLRNFLYLDIRMLLFDSFQNNQDASLSEVLCKLILIICCNYLWLYVMYYQIMCMIEFYISFFAHIRLTLIADFLFFKFLTAVFFSPLLAFVLYDTSVFTMCSYRDYCVFTKI